MGLAAQRTAAQSANQRATTPSPQARPSGVTTGWQKWVGMEGKTIGVDTFGASAPYAKIYEEYGLTAKAVVQAVADLLDDED